MPTARRPAAPFFWGWLVWAALAVVLAGGLLATFDAVAQGTAAVQAPAAQAASQRSAPSKPATTAKQSAKPSPTRPLWSELTEAQRRALAPLSGKWDTVSEAQKRKWIALSQNYPKMSAAEQGKLHSRMTEWVGLSSQQRTTARLNFGNTQRISPDDKKAKWEAYQALPPEEKKKLAAGASKPPPTAPAVKPVPSDKLAKLPQPKPVTKPARIAAGAHQVDPNTLLPQPSAAATN